jgi:uncharacterized protein (TIGR02246 family)
VSGGGDPVAARRQAWVAAVAAGDVDRYAELVARDVVWIPPFGEPIEGREAFRTWLAPFFARYAYDFSVEPAQIRAVAGWCAELGRFRSVLSTPGGDERNVHAGHYFVLWRRDVDGVWRIERYVDGVQGAS